MRRVGRFGHSAKVWLVIFALGYLPLLWIGPGRVNEGWPGFVGILAVWTLLGGAQLWIQTSQRVWYDDEGVCSHTWGGKQRERILYSDITSVTASHSLKRAAHIQPISELEISARNGRSIRISLRHLSLSDLQKMLDEIHQRTGLPVPELTKFVK